MPKELVFEITLKSTYDSLLWLSTVRSSPLDTCPVHLVRQIERQLKQIRAQWRKARVKRATRGGK